MGAQWPKIAVFVADCADARALESAMERIPTEVRELLTAIYAYSAQGAEPGRKPTKQRGWEKLTVLRNLLGYSFGGERKAGFAYALEQGFDYLLVLPAIEQLTADAPLAMLAEMLAPGVGATLGERRDETAMPRGQRWADRLLYLPVRDWQSGVRGYSTDALRRVPFALNGNGRVFDVQLLVQIKALGAQIAQVSLEMPATALAPTPGVLATALQYRLHQLHVYRHGRWLLERGERYTFKKSKFSSHSQILARVPERSRVLDLGCSQGLLAQELEKKGCHVVGVDRLSPEQVRLPYDKYLQMNLDDAEIALPFAREFDRVIVSDVIEHLQNRDALMAMVRRHLTEEGRLVISTGNIAIWFYRISLLLGRFEYGPRGILDDTHVRLFTKSTFERLVRNAGFEIVARETTTLPFELVFETRPDSAPMRLLEKTYHALTRLWPEMFAYQFIIEARIARLEAQEAPVWPAEGAKR